MAAGFEQSVANMYFIGAGLGIKHLAGEGFWQAIGKAPADFPQITWQGFCLTNLLPVILGNIIGGSLVVGLICWFVYLRRHPHTS